MPEIWLKTAINKYLYLILIGSLLVACESLQPIDECEFFEKPVEGYTQTDGTGKVISNDKNDWQTVQKYGLEIKISPVFPNPPRSATVNLQVTIYDLLGGRLSDIGVVGKNDKDQWVDLLPALGREKSTPDVGVWDLPVDISRLAASGNLSDIPGLHRIYIVNTPFSTDFCETGISFGDIYIVP